MRGLAFALALCSPFALTAVAFADGGTPWRATSPRVGLQPFEDGALALVVPAGRARGAASAPLPLAPGTRYRASVALDVDADVPRGAFLRVALYARPDGRGRQRRVIDSPVAPGDGPRDAIFRAPAWAHAARLRVLARPDEATGLRATGPSLVPWDEPPAVVLREDE